MKINQMEPSYGKEEKKAIQDYLDSGGWLTEYKKTRELENAIAKYTDSKFCSVLCNGTASLITALYAYDISIGDEVIVPDFDIIVGANVVRAVGAKPVLVDVEPETLCMDYGDFLAKVNKKTKAIMLVSLNGRYPTKIEPILEYCQDHNIIIAEDSAQALGSCYRRKQIGTYGDIGSFSFSAPKIITNGGGGCLVTDDKEIYEKICMIKNFGRQQSGVDQSSMFGLNFKTTDLQSVFLLEQMKKLPWRVKRKKEMYQLYRELLEDTKGISFLNTDLNDTTVWYNDIIAEKRNRLAQRLEKHGIGTRVFYQPIHSQPPYTHDTGHYPNSIYASEHGLWLPSSVKLTNEEIEYVCKKIKEITK